MDNNNTEVHFRKLDKKEDKSTGNDSLEYVSKTTGIVTKGNGLSTKNGKIAITRRSSSVAEISKKSATQINYCTRRYRLRKTFKKILLGLFVLIYVVAPICYWKCTWIRRHIIYLNVAFATTNLTGIDDPVLYGNFSCARNIYISPEEGISLGTWHVMPQSLVASRCSPSKTPKFLDEAEFDDKKPVILHLHGSGGSRGSPHRINLIKIFTNSTVDCHVVTMDYRGYGESTPVKPSVSLVTDDVRSVYRWLRIEKNVSNERIFFFGQSLGTGIAVHLAHDAQHRFAKRANGTLVKLGAPAGMILESPYTDIAEASRLHPYTYFHSYFPFFERFFVEPIRHSDTFWDSQSRIANVSSPVLILHAEDDDTIPYVLGKKLYEVAKARRDPVKQPTEMVTYEAALGYGHKQIYSDPGLPGLVGRFIWSHYRGAEYSTRTSRPERQQI